jgi:tetratricopeptide (TPR) repeat protein
MRRNEFKTLRFCLCLVMLMLAACGAEPTAAPTEVVREPVDSPVPPTEPPAQPTDTLLPPTDTPVPPTHTPVPPTDTPAPTPTPTPVPSPTPTMTTEELLEQVVTLYLEGNLEEALNVVDEAITQDPWPLEPYQFRHILRLDLEGMQPLEELDRMIAEYDDAIANDEEDAEAYYHLRGAAKYQRTVLSGEPVHEEPLFEDTPGVTVYGDQPMYGRLSLEHAISDLDQAIELDPDCAEAYHMRGLAYHLQGLQYLGIAWVDFYPEELEQAIRDYDQAIAMDPELAVAFHDRGTAYAQRGSHLGRQGDATPEEVLQDLERAQSDFAAAVELNPEAENTYLNRAFVGFVLDNHLDEAGDQEDNLLRTLDDSTQVIELNPESVWGHFLRGWAHSGLAELAEDESTAAQHESQSDEDFETCESLGSVLFQRYEISDLITRILTLSSGPPVNPEEAIASMLGVVEGDLYTSPDGSFRLQVPALMQPNAVIWDEVAASGGLLVWFEDDVARFFALQVYADTLGDQSLEEWVAANVGNNLDVHEQRQEDSPLGPAIVLLYRNTDVEADCCTALAHQDGRFYAATYCLQDHYAGEGEWVSIRDIAGGYGIDYEPVDALAQSLLEGLEIVR